MNNDNVDTLQPDLEQITLVQITDTHLFADADSELLGVPTEASFHTVVDSVSQTFGQAGDYQAVIMTGDISQDHTFASYQRFAQGIQPLTNSNRPCYWLPGNHDERLHMQTLAKQQGLAKQQASEGMHIKAPKQVLIGKHWQIILLDSQVPNSPHGELSKQQLSILEQALESQPERHALILMHHHSLLMDSDWLDDHSLHNRDEFWQRIAPYTSEGKSQVKGVVCGHVHQDFHQTHQGVEVISTPATCMQFKPKSDKFALDDKAPGWRSITLTATGEIKTQVHRLPQGSFLPEINSKGY